MRVSIFPDGDKNVTVTVTGWICDARPLVKVIDTSQMKGKPRTIRLSSVYFLIKEKAWIELYWDAKGEEPILPMESRGAFRFDQGIRPPDKWEGAIYMSTYSPDETEKLYLYSLDFDK